jgi:hypothetical protein
MKFLIRENKGQALAEYVMLAGALVFFLAIFFGRGSSLNLLNAISEYQKSIMFLIELPVP